MNSCVQHRTHLRWPAEGHDYGDPNHWRKGCKWLEARALTMLIDHRDYADEERWLYVFARRPNLVC